MMRTTPDTQTDQALEIWFAAAGLTVEVVERCAAPRCLRCAAPLSEAA
jgi:hypothetical protein